MAPLISIKKGKRQSYKESTRDMLDRIRRPLHEKVVGIDVISRQHEEAIQTLLQLKKA